MNRRRRRCVWRRCSVGGRARANSIEDAGTCAEVMGRTEIEEKKTGPHRAGKFLGARDAGAVETDSSSGPQWASKIIGAGTESSTGNTDGIPCCSCTEGSRTGKTEILVTLVILVFPLSHGLDEVSSRTSEVYRAPALECSEANGNADSSKMRLEEMSKTFKTFVYIAIA
jgi:hypothetical protein